MTEKRILYITLQIVKYIQYYLNSASLQPSHTQYKDGMKEILKIINTCYEKIETIYYLYILRPALEHHY